MTTKSIYYQLKKTSTTTSAGYVNVGGIVKVEVNGTADVTDIKEAIKLKSPAHLRSVDVGDIELWQGE